MYAKLVDGNLSVAPRTITKHYNPYPVDMMIEDGYKEVIVTPMPEYEEGYNWVYHYEEQEDKIVRVWEKEPIIESTGEEEEQKWQ